MEWTCLVLQFPAMHHTLLLVCLYYRSEAYAAVLYSSNVRFYALEVRPWHGYYYHCMMFEAFVFDSDELPHCVHSA